MCRTLDVHRSGFYAWLKQPLSSRAVEDKRLLGLIKQSWLESGLAYGYRNITRDLKDWGEDCGKNRIRWIHISSAILKIFNKCLGRRSETKAFSGRCV